MDLNIAVLNCFLIPCLWLGYFDIVNMSRLDYR